MQLYLKRYLPLAGIIFILQILAFLTSYFVTTAAVNGWYRSIEKSALTPPDWVFAPVWTVLYAVLGIVLWRLWHVRRHPDGRRALVFFAIQLVLNYTWSPVFFGLAAFTGAFTLILFIVIFTAAAMHAAHKVDHAVTWLLAPYLAWVSFATWLTFTVMRLN